MQATIITPTFNSGPYLRAAIESVLAQGRNVEHIVVDGGSRDGTLDLLRRYPSVRWISEPDSGMYDAINKGIRMAGGQMLAYLNADDRYTLGAVAAARAAFRARPEVQFVYGNCEYVDECRRPLFILRPLAPRWLKHNLRTLWPQPAWFWRRGVHDRIGYFDASLRHAGDAEFMRRLIANGEPGRLLDMTLAEFMLRRNCISVTASARYNEERLACRRKLNVDRWTPGRLVGEVLFAAKNLGTYKTRLEFRRCMG